MSDDVRIVFAKPREYKETEKAWILEPEVPGGGSLALPKSQTRRLEREGNKVSAAVVASFIAQKEGLIDSSDVDFFQEGSVVNEKQEVMTRLDWLRLGATMACLIRGETISEQAIKDAIWNGNTVATRLLSKDDQ